MWWRRRGNVTVFHSSVGVFVSWGRIVDWLTVVGVGRGEVIMVDAEGGFRLDEDRGVGQWHDKCPRHPQQVQRRLSP